LEQIDNLHVVSNGKQRLDLIITRQLTPWNSVLIEKPVVAQLVKKFSSLFMVPSDTYAVSVIAIGPFLGPMKLDDSFPPYFPTIHSNIVLPSTPRTSKLSLLFRFTDWNFVYIYHPSYACYMS